MMEMAKGIDVSHWQGEIDWPAVKNAGITFAFIKATERDDFVDARFKTNWAALKSVGILRGAYHFFRPAVDAKAQADHYVKTVRPLEEADLPPVLDLETRDGVSHEAIIKSARIWLREVEKALKRKPIIYTGPSFWNSHMLTAGEAPPWTREYSLWIANYQVSQPIVPTGFPTWTFWQFTDRGSVDGIDGNVDTNWFHGTVNDLRDFLGLDTLPTSRSYIVRPSDTLPNIAGRFNTTLKALVDANPGLIQANMELQIPLSAPEKMAETFYTIKPGDNLTLIAQRFNSTVDAIVKANNIQNPDAIEVGRVIKIPA